MKPALNDPTRFIRDNTAVAQAPLVSEISLHLATEITPIWQASEAYLEQIGIEPPFWAFAWPGSQLIARFILDNPEFVRERRVLDVACGCGLAAIAAAMSGASEVQANDIDPMALTATTLNASLNDVRIASVCGDLIGTTPDCDLLVIGDVCYNETMAARIIPWLLECSKSCEVWLCDPGRHYAPSMPLEILTRQAVPVTQELESADQRSTTLFRLRYISARG
ncbi:class I SAM-dependent methyltransferase [Gluconobacter kanchanaburiensis]|uniref:Nicotinamide N-methylase n=1 Tax=Gluconobacter kanchanaburiensis NBRC 103587 TaxID=1307948 RepID=A0A511B8U4_9PROT|nr:50S ribosomal protein L11 methyltransferase [Gluconobacter kanchanaburiensis]MBF0860638.1 methyltransferase [Gluconobacter kanchanaburiensis]GBR69516.1 50S ribosomal protein L11 methyltransferase [Gluconobacter kanchanaburiensis NBRC 103587]GEK96102.1 nicotinamide N-methylase [Gluconobacter kanchanaburiensis NBRC 103587]